MQGQENWRVLCSEDPHLDLNSFRTKVELPTGARSRWKLTGDWPACHNRCIMIYECKGRYLQEQELFRCKDIRLIFTLMHTKDKDSEMIATPQPRMARITNPPVGCHGEDLTGISPGSKAGSIAASSFIVTTVSVQGIKTQIEDSLDLWLKAHLAVKNTCRRMIRSRTMTDGNLDSYLRVPMIDLV